MRHKKAVKREIAEDAIYNNLLVAKFINRIMKDGKKNAAQKAFYGALEILAKDGASAIELFESAITNVGPKVEVKAKRVGGANYQVPLEVRGERKNALAIRWIVEAARARSNSEFHSFSEKLAAEIIDAAKGEGTAIKKRDNVLKMAEANRAFGHFRF
jgi:small subunit ribosomal protein S7